MTDTDIPSRMPPIYFLDWRVWGSLSIVFLFVCVLAYQSKPASAFVVLLVPALLGVYVNFDRISEFSANVTGLTVKIREVNNALSDVQRLAVLTGNAILDLNELRKPPLIVGPQEKQNPEKYWDDLRQKVLNLFRVIGVDQKDVTKLTDRIATEDMKEYWFHIQSYMALQTPKLSDNSTFEFFEPFEKLGLAMGRFDVPPDLLRQILDEAKVKGSERAKLEGDYSSLYNNHVHSDPEFWANRQQWGGFHVR